jgi:adenylyl-sulfate kinase
VTDQPSTDRQGFTVWFTGLSGSGKSTIAEMLYHEFQSRGLKTEILDGDEVRKNLSKGLGFSKEDRDTNIRRIGFVAELLSKHGVVAITAAISPYREIRDEVRGKVTRHGAGFCEVYVECPIEVLAERDVKGLYKKALAGEVKNFTGVSDPYEPPINPDVVVRSDRESVDESVEKIVATLKKLGYVPAHV